MSEINRSHVSRLRTYLPFRYVLPLRILTARLKGRDAPALRTGLRKNEISVKGLITGAEVGERVQVKMHTDLFSI